MIDSDEQQSSTADEAGPRHSEDVLEAMAIHIRYEFDYMNDAAIRVRVAAQDGQPVTGNLFLEAFLLHARNLIEFFFNVRRPWEDDVVALDYAEEWAPPITALAAEVVIGTEDELGLYRRMSKRLAHISTERLRSESGMWDVLGIARDLMTVFESFLSSIGDRATWFRKGYTTR